MKTSPLEVKNEGRDWSRPSPFRHHFKIATARFFRVLKFGAHHTLRNLASSTPAAVTMVHFQHLKSYNQKCTNGSLGEAPSPKANTTWLVLPVWQENSL